MSIYDVIVVGTGPAGAVTAYLLAKRGVNVLMLEREKLPRYKTCGGGVSWKALQNLPFDASEVFECKPTGGVLTYAGQHVLKAEVSWPAAWLVMRDRFDHYLVQQAIRVGARLMEEVKVVRVKNENEKVVVTTSAGEMQSLLLAGADGVNSIVAKSVGLMEGREVGVALEAELSVAPESLEAQGANVTFDFGAIPGGYGWIFPKHDHLSVGVLQAAHGKGTGIKEALEKFIASQAALRDPKPLHIQGHQIPLGGRTHTLDSERVLLAGDAANLADPWIGEGIPYALASARMAAEQIFSALESQEYNLSEYTRLINASIIPQLRSARLIAKVMYWRPELMTELFSRSRSLQEMVFSIIRGDVTFTTLTRWLFLNLPRIMAEAVSSYQPSTRKKGKI